MICVIEKEIFFMIEHMYFLTISKWSEMLMKCAYVTDHNHTFQYCMVGLLEVI